MSETLAKAVTGFTSWAPYYDETIANEVLKYCGMPYDEVLQRVIEVAGAAPGHRVLDVGAGTGALALALAKQMPESQVIGIDPTSEMLHRAQQNADNAGLAERVKFQRASSEALPFPAASFDLVVSSIALHHTHVRRSLAEIVRVLKPGGCLAVADMLRNARWGSLLGIFVLPTLSLYYLITTRRWAIMRAELAAYRQYFGKEDWEAMLQKAGLQVVSIQAFPHPSSKWYSGILIIRAGKSG